VTDINPSGQQWHYEPVADLDQPLIERLRCFPREPDMLVYGVRSLAALAIRGWLRAYHRFEIVGREHLPAEGSFVMVANHASHLDAVCLLSALPLTKLHRAFPAAASDYFFESVPHIWVAAVVINALPFARQVQVRQSLSLCEKLLANPGNVLIIFPEGTRSVTGKVGKFKAGIGILLAGSNVPVLPCYLAGAYEAWPKGRWFPQPGKLRLTIGRPRKYATAAAGKETACAIAAELQHAIEALKEQHETD
jgi:1-acyl-sn-glycerol-3-phosphate acyltransferase